MDKAKILAIVGSLREGSYNKMLAMATKEAIADRAAFTILEYADVPIFNQDIETPAPHSVSRVRSEVKAADALWFFTPEYNHYFSGALKNLIDWLSRPVSVEEGQVLAGKAAAISGTTPGMSGTGIVQDHLMTLLGFLNVRVMTSNRLTIPNVMGQTDENGKLALKASQPFLEAQVEAFLKFLS